MIHTLYSTRAFLLRVDAVAACIRQREEDGRNADRLYDLQYEFATRHFSVKQESPPVRHARALLFGATLSAQDF